MYSKKTAKKAVRKHPNLKVLVEGRVNRLRFDNELRKPRSGFAGMGGEAAEEAKMIARWRSYGNAIDRLDEVLVALHDLNT